MRRLVLPLALSLVIVVGAGIVASTLGADPPSRAEQAGQLAAELRCPDCQALSVAESRTTAAAAIRAEIDEQLASGRSMDEVRDHFVARYGEWILLSPRNPLPWIVPLLALLGGLGGLAWWLLRARGGGATEPGPAATAEELELIRDEIEALDA